MLYFYHQIASLKAALARKEGETEQHSRSSTPEKNRMKTFLSSPSLPSWKSVVEMSVNRTNSLEDVRNVEVGFVLKLMCKSSYYFFSSKNLKLNLIKKSLTCENYYVNAK